MGFKNAFQVYLARQYNRLEATHYQPSSTETQKNKDLRIVAELQENTPSKLPERYTIALNRRFRCLTNLKVDEIQRTYTSNTPGNIQKIQN
jgi:hypothetical protein